MINLLFGLLFTAHAFGSGTGVGDGGGDPVFEFMEATRTSMVETVKILVNDPKQAAAFCSDAKASIEQIDFCRQFFFTVAPEVLKLSQGMSKTLFVLREQSLFVLGPDGLPQIVSAKTDLGPLGSIELHRDSVKDLLPIQALFLITHEFLHKAEFSGIYITDNDPIEPFATGRDLLDTVATAIVSMARKQRLIGVQFGIRDIFDCKSYVNGGQFGALISTSRFFQGQDFMSYETSLGKRPSNETIYFPETHDTKLLLRMTITEPNNCSGIDPLRRNLVQIVRSKKLSDGSIDEIVLAEQEYAENPICPKSNPQIEIAAEQVRFVCSYIGSEGTTSSPF